MRKFVGEYHECLKKLYGSLRKRFKLNYKESLEEVDSVLDDEEFADYPVILISNDDEYSKEFIAEINESGEALAFGFYRDGDLAYKNVQEVREMVPKLLENNEGVPKFVYVSVDVRSFFRLPLPKSICIKQGRVGGELSVDIARTRPIIEDECIRMLSKHDLEDFNGLLNTLYLDRWSKRPDIFEKGYKLTSSELLSLTRNGNSRNAVVCEKNSKIVGFIIYEYVYDGDNRAFNRTMELTVKDVYVDVEYRRQGIGTRMYEEVLRIMEKQKSRRLKFKVWAEDEETKKFVSSLQPKALYTLYELDI